MLKMYNAYTIINVLLLETFTFWETFHLSKWLIISVDNAQKQKDVILGTVIKVEIVNGLKLYWQ